MFQRSQFCKIFICMYSSPFSSHLHYKSSFWPQHDKLEYKIFSNSHFVPYIHNFVGCYLIFVHTIHDNKGRGRMTLFLNFWEIQNILLSIRGWYFSVTPIRWLDNCSPSTRYKRPPGCWFSGKKNWSRFLECIPHTKSQISFLVNGLATSKLQM